MRLVKGTHAEESESAGGALPSDFSTHHLPPGTQIDHFEILSLLGQEARAAAALNHPNILALYHFGRYQDQPYIVSELLHGHTLRTELKGGALPLRRTLDCALQIARGLAAAHARGVVHRDLKPENIFVADDGQVKILDFGLAKLSGVRELSLDSGPTKTAAGVVLGTIGYMSPEQVRAEELDSRTDLFSFGAVLYEMGNSEQAFRGESTGLVFDAILNRPPVPPVGVYSGLPALLKEIINKCLEKDRKRRYQHASDICKDLQRLEGESGSEPVRAVAWATAARYLGMRWNATVVVVLAIAGMAPAGYHYLHRPHKLTARDTVVLADIVNATGDAVFDDTLKTALDVSLRQSPFLNVLSDNKVEATLQLMTRPAGTKLTPELAREVCLRAGSRAYLGGFIARLGDEYVLVLKAVACQSGDPLAQEQATAGSKEKVLDALGKAASRLRGELGESLATVQKYEVPLEQATTRSLDALKAYSAGLTALHRQGDLAAIPFFEHAIELDPNFAMAYDALGVAYSNISKPELGDEYNRRAFELRDRTSEWERFRISANYYTIGASRLDKAAETGELWAQVYAHEGAPHAFLSAVYLWLGQFERALSHTIVSLQNEPNNLNGLANLVETYMAPNRLSDAEAAADKMRLLAPDVPHYSIYFLGFVRGDDSEMQYQVALAKAGKGDLELLSSAVADTAAYHGRIEKQPTIQVAPSDNEAAAISQAKRALWEAEFHLSPAARADARAALAKAPTLYVRVLAALALARAGDSAAAKKLSNELEKTYPPDSMMMLYGGSSIRAALDLNRRDPISATKRLQAAASVELSVEFLFPGATMYPVYLRGMAYLSAHQGKDAAAEFQKFIEHRGVIANCPLGALAHLQLGRAYTMASDTAKARAAYEDFLTLWKDADPDIPILKQAKAEYAKLQ